MPDLFLHNSLTRKKERFEPLEPGKVRIYLCGLTVYADWHLGHALQAILFDTFRRYLRRLGYSVTLVNNFTDIDDKILVRAAEEGVAYDVVTERTIARYLEDLPRLNLERADHMPRATQHVPEMIALIRTLIERDHAYEAGGNVLFAVKSWKGYGQLSGNDPDSGVVAQDSALAEGLRRHPADFTLWKAAKPGEPSWESPWGPGRPGWHIECSAMALKYLGATFDIHIGGLDLIFPHHENERAQSEAATGETFARYWMHNGLLRVESGEKMSKSLGNTLGVRKLLERYSSDTLRHFVLSSHYRSAARFDFKLLEDSEKAVERLANVRERIAAYLARAGDGAAPDGLGDLAATLERTLSRVDETLADDFNTAGALGALFELAGETNRLLQDWERAACSPAARDLLGRVGTALDERLSSLGFVLASATKADAGLTDPLVELLLEVRQEARKRKDFAQSDRIRDRLAALGVELKDGPEGTRYTVKPRKAGAP